MDVERERERERERSVCVCDCDCDCDCLCLSGCVGERQRGRGSTCDCADRWDKCSLFCVAYPSLCTQAALTVGSAIVRPCMCASVHTHTYIHTCKLTVCMVGCALEQLNGAGGGKEIVREGTSPTLGVICCLIAISTSGFAGVYTEKMLKNSGTTGMAVCACVCLHV